MFDSRRSDAALRHADRYTPALHAELRDYRETLAARLSRMMPPWMTTEDIEQEIAFQNWQSLQRFEPERGVAQEKYVTVRTWLEAKKRVVRAKSRSVREAAALAQVKAQSPKHTDSRTVDSFEWIRDLYRSTHKRQTRRAIRLFVEAERRGEDPIAVLEKNALTGLLVRGKRVRREARTNER